MMRPRWRKVLHDLTGSLSRTALVVVSIVVGVFSIGVIVGTYVIISHDMSASYAANNPMNVELLTDDFDSNLVKTIQDMSGVKQAEGRRVFSIQARVPGNSQWVPLNVVAIDDFSKQKINLLHVLSGIDKPAKKQVLLEQEVLQSLNVKAGSSLEFLLDNGSTRVMQVVGVVQDPSTGAGDFLGNPFVYVTTDTLSYLHQPDMFNRLYATVTNGQNDTTALRAMAAKIKDSVEKSGITILETRSSKTNEHPLASTVQAILGILLALGILILFLSSSLIANTLSALLNQHLRHIGVMKLVGGRRNQIFTMYIILILGFGVIALLIAVPLGGQGAYALSAFIAKKINFNLLGYRIVPLAFAVQIVVGLAVPLLAGLGPVLNGSRITVLSALSGDMVRDQKKQSLDAKPREPAFDRLQGWVTINPGKARGAHPASSAHLVTKHLPPAGTPYADTFYVDHGRCHLYRGFQRTRHVTRLRQPDWKLFSGGCVIGFHPNLPAERGEKYCPAGARSSGSGRLGIRLRRGTRSGWDSRRYDHDPGSACEQ